MTEQTREIVGFLSRWLLLAIMAAAGFATAGLCAGAVAGLSRGPLSSVTLPDALAARPGYVAGYFEPPHPGKTGPAAMSRNGGLRAVYSSGRRMLARMHGSSPGPHHVEVIGAPYGRLAFCQAEAMVWLVAPGREACLLDARFLSEDSALPVLRDLLPTLRGEGFDVAMFWVGPEAEYEAQRRAARALHTDLPVLHMRSDKPGLPPVIASRRREFDPLPIVVTPDAELATLSAKGGFPTFLIGGEASVTREHLEAMESLGEFKEAAGTRPIRH